jgi:serine/threonine-protein phosphatase 2A regulatory subunit B
MPHAEFQSHESSFDYLKSLEIGEGINEINWLQGTRNSLFLLSTNDKTVKLWKVFNKSVYTYDDEVEERHGGAAKEQHGNGSVRVKFPKKVATNTTIVANPRRIYANAHNYHINSISSNIDGETFLSSDDLRIHLWNLENSSTCYNVVDIKPDAMEDLTEVITSATFSPVSCHILLHTSSKGTLKLGDLRTRGLVDNNATVLTCSNQSAGAKTFFSEILSSVSSAKFSPDGRYIVSRDYMTLKLWDVNHTKEPVSTINIHPTLSSKFVTLYENDCIFDKFGVSVSSNGNWLATGSYNNTVKVYNAVDDTLEACVTMVGGGGGAAAGGVGNDGGVHNHAAGGGNMAGGEEPLNYNEKVLHLCWETNNDVLAVCGRNRLYLYSAVSNGRGGLRRVEDYYDEEDGNASDRGRGSGDDESIDDLGTRHGPSASIDSVTRENEAYDSAIARIRDDDDDDDVDNDEDEDIHDDDRDHDDARDRDEEEEERRREEERFREYND